MQITESVIYRASPRLRGVCESRLPCVGSPNAGAATLENFLLQDCGLDWTLAG